MYYIEYLKLQTDLKTGYKSVEDYKRSLQKLINKIVVDIQQKNIAGDAKKVIEIINDVKNMEVPCGIQKRFDNILLNEMEMMQKKSFLKSKPRVLYCVLTNLCNVKCIMCQTIKNEWELPEHAIDEIISLMPYLENIIWQGGEIFLYKHFESLMDASYLNKVNQEIVTNGLLLNEHNINKLIDYNIDLGISIDGLTKEVYEYIRVGASFDKLIKNMVLFKKIKSQKINKKSHLRLNVLVMKSNIDQIEFFPEFASKYGFTRLCVNSFGPDFISEENIFHYNKNKEFIVKIIKIKEKLLKKCEELHIELVDSLPSYSNIKKSECEIKYLNKTNIEGPADSLLFCHVPWRKIFISSDGTIMPECFCNKEYALGNIGTDKIDEIWNNEKMRRYREKIINNSYKGICKKDCVEGRIPEKILKDVINTNLFWWEF